MQRHGDFPLTPTHFNSLRLGDADLCKCTDLSWVQVMVCHLMGVKPLSELMLTYHQGQTLLKLGYKNTKISIHGNVFATKCQPFILNPIHYFIGP